MSKEFKSGIRMPSEAQVFAATRGIPFERCPNCGLRPKVSSEKYCRECSRLREIGFGATPRAPRPTVVDTQEKQSYDAFKRSGYSDTIPSRKIDPTRERF